MAFHKSSEDIDVVDGYLRATCKNYAGEPVESDLHLDAHLGNTNGFFQWGGRGFSRSATNIALGKDGDSLYLYANLKTQHNSWRDAKVNLSDRISNSNGKLKYIGGVEPQIEHSRQFLGPEMDLIHAAFSDTMSDLRELFSSTTPLFDFSDPATPRRERSVPRENHTSASQRDRQGSRGDTAAASSDTTRSNTEASSASSSVPDTKDEPPAYDLMGEEQHENTKGRPESSADKKMHNGEGADTDKSMNAASSADRKAREHEDMVLARIVDFLMNGTDNSVHSFRKEDGARGFELRGQEGFSRILYIPDRTLFDQDEHVKETKKSHEPQESKESKDSESETPDRCMTPSVVDGEDEYDFLT